MKRLIALALAMLLALAIPAQAATGDVVLGHEDDGEQAYFNGCFSDGDTLYIYGYTGLCSYRLGDQEMKEYGYKFPENPGEGSVDTQLLPFLCEGSLYALLLCNTYSEYSQFDHAELCTVTLDGESAVLETLKELDWSDMVEYYGESSYANLPLSGICIGRKLLMRCQGETDSDAVRMLDIDTGKLTSVDGLENAVTILPYKDGSALVQMVSYDQSGVVRMAAYDPQADSVRMLGEFEPEDYGAIRNLAYDPETDTAYCVKSGEICPIDLATGQVGEGITDMPLDGYSGSMCACVLTGGYYAFAGEGVAVRSLHPDTQSDTKLKIADGSWNESVNTAYYRFINAHGDVRVVLSRDYSDSENVIENMMNRDSNVDIYVMYASSTDYEALYNRGYMLELDGCEKVRSFVDSAYPSLAEGLMYKGHVVALPVDAYSFALGVNEKALNSIGLQLSDVPTNWVDFLAFLNTLPEYLGEDGKVKPFYSESTIEDLKTQLFYDIFDTYQRYVNATDPAMGYNTDLMRRIMAGLDAVDFEALGYEHQQEEGGDVYASYGGDMEESAVLFMLGVGCTFGNFYQVETRPVLMSLDADTPAIMTLDTTIAFVNPFTRNPETAMAFMDELADCLSDSLKYCFIPELDTPIRGEYNEKNAKELQEELDNLKAQLETADPEEKQALEESIRQYEESLADCEQNGWEISRLDIDWYRANDEHLLLAKANWLYSDGAGEAWDLISQYQAGQISGEEMLAGIDKKVQMMLMEGN